MTGRPSLAAAEREQRAQLAAAACEGRRVVELGEAGAAEWLAAAAPDVALVALDGPPEMADTALAETLAAAVEAGAALVLAVPASSPRTLAVLTAALPQAAVVRQHAVGLTWLDGARPTAPEDEAAPRWTLLVAGVPVPAVGSSAVTAPVAAEHVTALERRLAELRATNAWLARRPISLRNAAAAALAARAETVQQQLDEQRRRTDELEDHVRDLEARLQDAVEAARRNDEHHQQARALLRTPPHRAAESLAWRLRRVPGVGPRLGGR